MPIERLEGELLPKRLALPIFCSDPFSSVAYATEAALGVLVAASLASRGLVLPISAAVALLMVIVVASYRQTIHAYPSGGGAYVVARENLGTLPGLIAAASLLVDYVLTVAVSIAAGTLAITSAAPALRPYLLALSLAFLALLLLANLRGLRESGMAFALPTYLFIAAIFVLVAVGIGRGLIAGWPRAQVPQPAETGTAAGVGLLVLLRSFASGCTALTGVEAIANGVTAFRRPQARNAAQTITIMGVVAVTFFLGVSLIAWKTDARPSGTVSVLSEVARASFGRGPLGDVGFYLVQITTFAVLVLAANTAFQGFPRLSALIAQDGFAPRQLQNLGDRLVYSNGIVVLSVLAGLLLVAFNAQVDQLIHLYLIGVFSAFTLSQAGMVRFWKRRLREGGVPREVFPRMALNAVGAAATGVVGLLVIGTKFTQGAWMVTVAVPVIVAHFVLVHRHYRAVAARLRPGVRVRTDRPGPGPVLIFVEDLDAAAAKAVRYAQTIGGDFVQAIHVPGEGDGGDFRRRWQTFSGGVAYKELHFGDDPAGSLITYLHHLPRDPDRFVTVVIPELFQEASLLAALRRRSSFALKFRLLGEPGVVITDVPVVASPPTSAPLVPPRLEFVDVLVPVSSVNDPTLRALDYALALRARSVRAIHIALGSEEDAAPVQRDWAAADLPIPLEVIPSPYRDLGTPLLEEVRRITSDPEAMCAVVMPEAVLSRRRHRLLHNQRALFIKRLLIFEERTVLVDVPYQLE